MCEDVAMKQKNPFYLPNADGFVIPGMVDKCRRS